MPTHIQLPYLFSLEFVCVVCVVYVCVHGCVYVHVRMCVHVRVCVCVCVCVVWCVSEWMSDQWKGIKALARI